MIDMRASLTAACLAVALGVALAAPGVPLAQGVTRLPPGPVLRLSGEIDGRSAVIGARELAALGRETVRAVVPWQGAPAPYEGVPLARLLDHMGAAGDELELFDGRGHSLGFSIADAVGRGALLVERPAQGPAGLGKRGPFWLVFPLADDGRPSLGPPAVAGLVELRVR